MFNCRKCNIGKPIEDFIKDKTRTTGHHPYCRLCQNKIKNNKRSLERSLAWQKENKDKRSVTCKKWNNNNPESCRINRHKRRERVKNNSDGTVNKGSISRLPKTFCAICNIKLKWETPFAVHLDHVIPLSKGGKHSINNLQWTCNTCNLSKGNKIKAPTITQ